MLFIRVNDRQRAVYWQRPVDLLLSRLLVQSGVVATDVLQIAVLGVDGRRVLPAG